MTKRNLCQFLSGLLCLFLIQTSIFAQTPTPTPENATPEAENIQGESKNSNVLKQEAEKNLLHHGDLIDVDVVGSAEYDWRGNLSPEGFLSGIGYVGDPVYGLCRSETEVAMDIAVGISKILKDPQVVVKILDRSRRPVALLYGAVRTPQRFQIQRPVRLNELLIISGGLTEKASGEIQVLRPPNLSCESKQNPSENQPADNVRQKDVLVSARQNNDAQFINVKISDLIKGLQDANPLIFSGDVITVLEAQSIYVSGGVVNPKQVNAHSQMTLSRAISAAGGLTKDADPQNVLVFRRDKNESKIIEVDYEKIKSSEAEDVALQAFDVVEVSRAGREKRKLPPVIYAPDNKAESLAGLPLRIID